MIIWLVTEILSIKESLQLAQAMSFDFKDNISLSKCALWGKLKPINLNNFACLGPTTNSHFGAIPKP